MNQTIFKRRVNVEEVKRMSDHLVLVYTTSRTDLRMHLDFTMETSTRLNDTPKVNDEIIVTIETPAPKAS